MGWAWNTQCSEIPCYLRFLGVHEKRVRCHPRVPDFALLFKMQEAWRRKWHPTPLFLPGESHGQRSLEGYSPRGLKESDTSEPLSLPLHGMIFNSKLTVMIKFSLNIKKKKMQEAVCRFWPSCLLWGGKFFFFFFSFKKSSVMKYHAPYLGKKRCLDEGEGGLESDFKRFNLGTKCLSISYSAECIKTKRFFFFFFFFF